MREELENMLGPEHSSDLYRIRTSSHSLLNRHQLIYSLGNDIISESDRDNIRAFKLKMFSNMPRRTFNQVRHTFRHKCDIDSEWVMTRRIAILSGIEPIKIDCCIKFCIAYTGKYERLEECPYCHENRYTHTRKPRRIFSYIPLIPRLQSFYQSKSMAQKLSYRHDYQHDPNRIRDVFDSNHYRNLLARKVKIDGVQRPYNFFSDKRDIALALSVDGYLIFKRRRSGPSSMPILLINYNLPPEIRNHYHNLLCLGIIHKPKDLASYLAPFEDECAELAMGIRTFDATTREIFLMHAYTILAHGDIIAIERLLGFRGHNAYCPCRSCTIKGVRDISSGGTTYYVPLITPDLDHQPRPSMDPRALPLRTHAQHVAVLEKWESAPTKTRRKVIGDRYGIRHQPALRRVSSIDHAVSFPWEWMHLFSENQIPNLIKIWSGKFKGLDVGTGSYLIGEKDWEQIGLETAGCVGELPSSYVRVLGNIHTDSGHYNAEAWAFWLMYIAPIVLKDRFDDDKYYDHAVLLVKIMKKTLRFELTLEEIDDLENEIIHWVELYEEYVFRFSSP